MELAPKIPSERVFRALIAVTAIIVALLVVSFAWDLGERLSVRHVVRFLVGSVVALLLVRPVVRANATLRIEGALDRFECALASAARSWFVASLFGLAAQSPWLRVVGGAAFAAACALVVVLLWRDRTRAQFLSRVYANEEPEYRIERDEDVRGFELLPPVLSGTITDGVIAHRSASETYRTSHGPRPLARVTRSLAKMNARLFQRRRAVSTSAGVALSFATLAIVAPLAWKSPAESATLGGAKEELTVPSCSDAIPYFEERLQAIPGVGRATLLTRDRDGAVPEGSGLILVVPARGAAPSDAVVLRAARAIPCAKKLALSVEPPRYRAFKVSAQLTLESGADEKSALHDADEEVRELFEPDARTVYNEHIGFGATEKNFGYRVRHALRHVSGVAAVRVTINGGAADVPLGPRDYPTLESLSLDIVR